MKDVEPVSPQERLKELEETIAVLKRNDARADFVFAEVRGVKDSLSWFRWRLDKFRSKYTVGEYFSRMKIQTDLDELLRDLEGK